MNFRILLIYIILLLWPNTLFGSSDALFATESSIIPFQLSSATKPILHMGALWDSSGVNLISGIQIQPTTNLLLGGALSPQQDKDDLAIYYHMLIGYTPKWKLLKITSNMFQIGIHRYRFSTRGDLRWLSFSVMEKTTIGNLNINMCWNRLFTQKWERNTVFISTDIRLLRGLYLRPGAIAYFTPDFDYLPFILVSMDL